MDPGLPLPPHAATLVAGQRLAGRYRIEALLGRGGMGTVYRAHDEQTGRDVAVKTILIGAGASDTRRFRREFRVLTRLSHPHIISVHDYGLVDGLPYYVMEYIRGCDLRLLLANRVEPLSLTGTLTIGIQMAQALAFVHSQGIVHRDIKPSNIMVLQDDGHGGESGHLTTKLMDFGLVKVADISAHLTVSGALVGTLRYLAPEQMKGLTVDRRADLYSLGLVLYESATREFPFSGETGLELAFQRLGRPPTPPQAHNPALPMALNGLILKLLAADPNQRYASAEALLADLGSLAGASVAIAPPPPRRADVIARPPLIGRDEELDYLANRMQAGWEGAGGFVLVEGEAGVGKTRLLRELASLARQAGGRCLQGACYEEERIAYGPLVEALEGAVTSQGGGRIPAMEGLESELARLLPSLDVTAVGFAALEPEQARLRLFDAVTRLLARLAEEKPVLLLLDDLQWVDEASLELLHYLVRNLRHTPVWICGAARLEEMGAEHPLSAFLQGLGRRKLAERMPLGRLSPPEAADLVSALLAGGSAPHDLPQRLYQEAEGNPFFVEEMLKAWVEEGRLVLQDNRWQMTTGGSPRTSAALSIPNGIADVVGRRLRGVDSIEMSVLERAAVLGREFNFEVLLQMDPDTAEDRLLDAIEEMLRARLLEEIDHPLEDRYRFAHSKIQEVVYSRISRRRARRLHLRAGEAMEHVYAGRTLQVVQPLARHFSEAVDPRGVDYGLRAGDVSRAVFANQEALDHYRRALELVGTLQEQPAEMRGKVMAIHAHAAEVYFLVGQYQAAAESLADVLALLPDASLDDGERRQRAAATHRRLADVHEAQGRYDRAMTELEMAHNLLPPASGRSLELALIHQGIAWVQRRMGDCPGALESCARARENLPMDNQAALADLEDTVGVVYRDLGEFDRAADHHRRSLALREQMSDQPGIAKTCNNLAAVNWHQGGYETSIATYRQSLAICEKIGHTAGVASVYNNLGLIYAEQKAYERAIQQYQLALTLFDRIGNQLGVALACGNLGEAFLSQGNLAEAIEHSQSALRVSDEIGDREGVTYANRLLAQIYLEQGEPAQAIRAGKRALAVAGEINARPYAARAHQVLGLAYRASGQLQPARTHLEAARQLYDDLGNLDQAAQAEAALQTLS